jgi:7 transmembrane receptor (rhodopsin family)
LICHWEHYERIYTKRNTILLCLTVWLVIYLIELPNHVGWGDLRFSKLFFVCTFANHVHSYALFYVLVGIFLPISISFGCYFKIYLKVKDSRLTRSRILYAKSDQESPPPTEVNAASQLSSAGNCGSVSQKFYEDLKVIQVLFRVFLIYLLMWLPLVLLILLHLTTSISYVWYVLVLLSAHGNSAINCLIYAATIEHFRQGYKKLLGFNRPFGNSKSRKNMARGSRGRTNDQGRNKKNLKEEADGMEKKHLVPPNSLNLVISQSNTTQTSNIRNTHVPNRDDSSPVDVLLQSD